MTPKTLRRTAIAVLVVGLAASAITYLGAHGNLSNGSNYQIVGGQVFETGESVAQRAATERMGGHALVMTSQFNGWLASLWHGERLAYSIGVLSLVIAWVCWWFAGMMEEEVDD